jgi:alpha-1,4-digalacturonate transport system permease protein
MMRQYMIGIPGALLESARIDGASDWKIYRHIILLLSAPVLGSVGILSFTWRWNDYLWPLIVINNQQKYTLQLSLANLIGTNTVEWGYMARLRDSGADSSLGGLPLFPALFPQGIDERGG